MAAHVPLACWHGMLLVCASPQSLRPAIFALRAFNVETGLIAAAAKSEMLLLMRTLRDMNLSKYVAEDVPLFLSLIGDLFPGRSAEKAEHPYLEKARVTTVSQLNLQMHPPWKEKIIQLWEMALVRHSLMLVGPSGVGKTKILEVLMTTLDLIAT